MLLETRYKYREVLEQLGLNSKELLTMLQVAEDSKRIANEIRSKPELLKIERKEDSSVVGAADYAVQAYTDLLVQTYGGLFLGEEHGGQTVGTPNENKDRWIVDGVDGTTNFSAGIPGLLPSCTSIALERDGEMLLGVVISHDRNVIFFAEKGKGAFIVNNGDLQKVSANADRRLDELTQKPSFGYGHVPREVRANIQKECKTLLNSERLPDSPEVKTSGRNEGCVAWELCLVAGHAYACYITEANLWDYAAGLLIAQESGAFVKVVEAKDGGYDTVMAAHRELEPLAEVLDRSITIARASRSSGTEAQPAR